METLKLYNHVTRNWDELNLDKMGREEAKNYLPQTRQIQNRYFNYILVSQYTVKRAFLTALSDSERN